jgi:hypothetical protein
LTHGFEQAPSGRAKCRACGAVIAAGDIRFGERLPNPFVDAPDAEMTHWYHAACAAYRRPEPFIKAIEALGEGPSAGPDLAALEAAARLGVAHPRVARIDAAARAPSGRAACRACREPIEKAAWRIALRYYEDGRFMPSGYIHLQCAAPYFDTTDILPHLRHFSPELSEEEIAEIARALTHNG